MIRIAGYSNLYEVRRLFRPSALDDDTRVELLEVVRKNELEYRERTGRTSLYIGPSVAAGRVNSEVHSDLSAGELWSLSDRECVRAFRNFVSRVPVFLAGPDGEAIPAASFVVDAVGPRPASADRGISWFYLSDVSLCIDIESRLEVVEAAKLLLAKSVASEIGSRISGDLKRLVRREAEYRALRQFQGFLVCIEEKAVPDKHIVRWALGFDWPDENPKPSSVPRGRPRKVEAAAEAYAVRFPDGHGGYSWKVVCEVLREEQGIHVSVDTLRKAVEALKNGEIAM